MSEQNRDPFEALTAYARHLEAQVPGELARLRVARAFNTSRPSRKRLVAALAVGMIGVSNVALARMADPAIPGDSLYAIDRAYEKLTALVGSDHAGERLDEASAMAARGEASSALALVREALTDETGAADVEKARVLVSEMGSAELSPEFSAALDSLIEVARSVSVSDDRQAAAQELGDSGLDVSEAAKRLQEMAPNRADQDAGSNSQRP